MIKYVQTSLRTKQSVHFSVPEEYDKLAQRLIDLATTEPCETGFFFDENPMLRQRRILESVRRLKSYASDETDQATFDKATDTVYLAVILAGNSRLSASQVSTERRLANADRPILDTLYRSLEQSKV